MYMGFKALKEKIAKNKKVKNPAAVAASVAYKKYGKKAVQEHAHKDSSMEHAKHKKHFG